jgi:hypothetical protein
VKATSAGKQMNYAVAELTFGKFNVAYWEKLPKPTPSINFILFQSKKHRKFVIKGSSSLYGLRKNGCLQYNPRLTALVIILKRNANERWSIVWYFFLMFCWRKEEKKLITLNMCIIL